MVASDRISIFDFVLDTTIPDKGEILTRMSLWWFDQLADLVPNHVISHRRARTPVRGRAVVCERLDDVPGRVRRPRLPHRLRAARLPRHRRGLRHRAARPGSRTAAGCPTPIFTPATKAELGDHDENVSYDAVVATIGAERAAELRDLTLEVYAPRRGDRPRARHHPGRHQARVRRPPRRHDGARRRGAHPRLVPLLAGRRVAAGPHAAVVRQADRAQLGALARVRLGPRRPARPPPPLPPEVVERTRSRYVEAYELLTGQR